MARIIYEPGDRVVIVKTGLIDWEQLDVLADNGLDVGDQLIVSEVSDPVTDKENWVVIGVQGNGTAVHKYKLHPAHVLPLHVFNDAMMTAKVRILTAVEDVYTPL
ncbi:MAG: hypothetical protein H6550_16235 [Chitinophagales bacterium]|nr:hypothetical protein [Chitinophagales bacterium]